MSSEQFFKRILTPPIRQAAFLLFAAHCFLLAAYSQKIAVLTPAKTAVGEAYAEKLAGSLSEKFKVLNSAMSEAAFLSAAIEKPFNMTTDEGKTVGEAIGSDFFLIVRSENLHRFALEKKEYFESYAAVYTVSSRTGGLVFWKLQTFTGSDPKAAEKLLFNSIDELANEISVKLPIAAKAALTEERVKLEEIPAENSPDAKNFRAPLPYRRISPPYTPIANLYSVAATVDIEVDFDEEGKILRTAILRWAGFGLDEAVTETVRKMNWRAASRGGKPLPVRVLLRYNFKKIEKEE